MNNLKLNKIKVNNFSLKHTLECGQFFYYIYDEKTLFYYIVNGQNLFKIKQEENYLHYAGINEKDLIYFLSLDVDLTHITKTIGSDEYLLLSFEKYFGMQILRQDFWQCLISFVCSSASNIPKIQKNIFLLSEYFGEKVEFDNKTFYLFPRPGSINDIQKIKDSKTGFRAKYIFEINKIVTENPTLLKEISKMDYNDAKIELMKLPGIGSKVADCISLFSLNHNEAFPIDTWVKQIIEKWYLKREAKNLKEIEMFIQSNFGKNKGIKQQYLFHYARNHL